MLGFLIGMLLYVVAVFVAYSEPIKNSPYYMPIGLALAFATNLIWLLMIKNMNDKSEIMTKSFTWDGMRILIYAIVPALLLGAPVSSNKVVACILIGLGMYLLNH